MGLSDPILLIGSCFSENMCQYLDQYKFQVAQNPCGILFNPHSVAACLALCQDPSLFSAQDLFEWEGVWHSWSFHGRFSHLNKSTALDNMQNSLQAGQAFLAGAKYLVITLGSAWVHELTHAAPIENTGQIVANNHKAPAHWFRRRLLKTEEVLAILDQALYKLFKFNPGIQVVFTISPVRHLREGAIDNNRSKAILNQAVHHLVDKFDRLFYFPAYELVVDDLRDYRFYAEDGVHPNYSATQYVWEKFVEACLDKKTQQVLPQIKEIQLAFQHRPLYGATAAHADFLSRFANKTAALQALWPQLDFSKELAYFRGEMANPPH
jgi:hypothetical protein